MNVVKRFVGDVDGFEFVLKVINRRLPCSSDPESYSVFAYDTAYGFFYSSDVILGNFKEFENQFSDKFSDKEDEIALDLSSDGETLTLKFNNHTVVMKSRLSKLCETNIRQVKRVLTEYDIEKLRYEYLVAINNFNQTIYTNLIQK